MEKVETNFVEAADVERTTLVDVVGADTEDAASTQTSLREHDTDRHGGRKCRWHDDGDEIETAHNHH